MLKTCRADSASNRFASLDRSRASRNFSEGSRIAAHQNRTARRTVVEEQVHGRQSRHELAVALSIDRMPVLLKSEIDTSGFKGGHVRVVAPLRTEKER